MRRRLPAGSLAEVGEVADAVLALPARPDAMLTGQIVGVEGGWTAW